MPSCSSDEHLANNLSYFLIRKITTFREEIDNQKLPINDAVVMSADTTLEGQPLIKLASATQDEVRDIIIKSPSKSCELDPLPIYLLNEVLEYLLPWITAIINKSLVESNSC